VKKKKEFSLCFVFAVLEHTEKQNSRRLPLGNVEKSTASTLNRNLKSRAAKRSKRQF